MCWRKRGVFHFQREMAAIFQVLTEKVCQCNFETCNSSRYPDFFWIIFQILQVGNLSLSWTFYGSLSFILKSTVQVSDKIVNFIYSCIFCSIQMDGSVSSRQNCVVEKWYGYYQRETPSSKSTASLIHLALVLCSEVIILYGWCSGAKRLASRSRHLHLQLTIWGNMQERNCRT